MRSFFACQSLALAFFSMTPSATAQPKVTIKGGADASGHQYAWTVENDDKLPIVEIEFPHYHGSLFFAPGGWTQDCTNIVRVGAKDSPGRCIARADKGGSPIAPGRRADFGFQIASTGALRSPGDVRVVFSDGATRTISGVEVPTPPPTGDRFIPLVGMAAIFLLVVLFGRRRTRRKSINEPSAE